MGTVTTYSEGGRVVVHSGDDSKPVEVVQLPLRDAAIQAASPAAVPEPAKQTKPPAPAPEQPATPAAATPAVKAATKRMRARIKTGKR